MHAPRYGRFSRSARGGGVEMSGIAMVKSLVSFLAGSRHNSGGEEWWELGHHNAPFSSSVLRFLRTEGDVRR